jgi:hypothetical protein
MDYPEKPMVVNEREADHFIAALSDDSIRRYIATVVACAKVRLIRRAGQTEAEWRQSLPPLPVDFLFLAASVADSLLDGSFIVDARREEL